MSDEVEKGEVEEKSDLHRPVPAMEQEVKPDDPTPADRKKGSGRP